MLEFSRLWWAFLRRDLLNAASYRFTFVLSAASFAFYLLLFFFVGRVFSGIGSAYLARYGGEYFPFVLVGLAVESVVGVGLGGFSQAISTEQYLGTLEPMLTGPGQRSGPFRVLTAAALSRYVLSSARLVAYFVAGVVFLGVRFQMEGVPLFLAATALTAAAYFGLGMLSAAYTLVFKQGNPINLFFGQMALILSGVFFPVEVLPSWLRGIGAAVPLTHGLALGRAALLGGETSGAAGPLVLLAAFALAFLIIGTLAFNKALKRARKDGSLGQY